MLTIWKFPIRVTDIQQVDMPATAQILDAQFQHGVLCLWALVDDKEEAVERTIHIFGTGHEFNEAGANHIATVQQGPLVWHIFE